MSTLVTLLTSVADDVLAARDDLNRLDAVAGDGDLGITMATVATTFKALVSELEHGDLAIFLKQCGAEIARTAPSSGGTLVATAFLRAGRVATDTQEGRGLALLVELVATAQQGIEERGKARPGSRTMLDALAPAAAALRAAADQQVTLSSALGAAAAAAMAGAEATKTMRATVGRAGWLAERAEGYMDAGAFLVAIVFASAARHARD